MRRGWFLCVLVLLFTLGISLRVASAEIIRNVAAGRPVTGAEIYGGGSYDLYPENAVDENYGSGSGGSFVANDADPPNTWWKVDLEQNRTVESVRIYTQSASTGERIDGAWLRAYDENNVQIGGHIVLDGYEDVNNEIWYKDYNNGGAGWSGVRYFLVGGEDGHGPNGGAAGHTALGLGICEFEAYGQLPTYPGFITGITATASSVYGDGAYSIIQAQHVVNDSGMSDRLGPVVGDPDAVHALVNGDFWCTNPLEEGETPSIMFDLNGEYDLARMLIWNCNQGLTNIDRGLKEVLIETSLDGSTWTALPDMNGSEEGNFTIGISQATEENGDTGYTGDVGMGGVTAEHVRITAYSCQNAERDIWGLSEVRLYAVPEPSMFGLLILGLLTLASSRRRTNNY